MEKLIEAMEENVKRRSTGGKDDIDQDIQNKRIKEGNHDMGEKNERGEEKE